MTYDAFVAVFWLVANIFLACCGVGLLFLLIIAIRMLWASVVED